MPWSNQNGGGGGPWGGGSGGGGNKGPWGQGPNRPRGGGGGRGNGGPPDLEEIFRRGQDQLKGVVPGGFNGGVVAIIGLLIVGFVLMNSIYTVQPDERGVEMRFGKPKEEISMPGLHYHFWPLETVEMVKITEQQQNIGSRSGAGDQSGSGLMLTGDQNIVNVQFSVLFSVTDPKAYLFNVEDPSDTLQQVAESAMREVVGRRPAQDIFRDNRQAIAADVKTTIQATMDTYGAGVSVNTVAIEDAAPPREVADAFDEVQRAEQDEDRFVEEANQYANQVLGKARGQAAQLREEAAAYKDRVVKEAQGEAQRFISVYDAYAKAPDVTRKRLYLETMQSVLGKSKKVILDEKNGQGVLPYLPLNEIVKPAQSGGAQ
ncbi:FtsH protease activity modulator HflK [Rhizobium sp. LjRoot98]|uniref:FtsH protease activity modulator HflK n=1 Tax=unclassified Rhizobium TaxID=2613769 RepID=UPI000715FFB1|nr:MULTISPECIES: FtsH protease activity modulator HflK [unclassified Rhizobium]KQV29405.1 phage tail protein [Rhizobium sp. Root1204]KQY05327.1 phage tail protein [Rhizobium sp. Root1334]KRC01944.1 phage tail protein [Rhizobium sp. Root73]